MEKIELSILGLTVSQSPDSYIILLKNKEENKRIPIIIGANEAQSIAVAIDNMELPRPLTHDVFFNVMTFFDIHIKEVYIHDIKNGIFYADMLCEQNEKAKTFDIRPSDAIAMAVRFGIPIYSNEKVLELASVTPVLEDKKSTKQQKSAMMSVEEIEKAIEKAIKIEDYETASLLRDILKQKNNPTKKSNS